MQPALVSRPVELGVADEVVVDAFDLARPRRPRRRGDGEVHRQAPRPCSRSRTESLPAPDGAGEDDQQRRPRRVARGRSAGRSALSPASSSSPLSGRRVLASRTVAPRPSGAGAASLAKKFGKRLAHAARVADAHARHLQPQRRRSTSRSGGRRRSRSRRRAAPTGRPPACRPSSTTSAPHFVSSGPQGLHALRLLHPQPPQVDEARRLRQQRRHDDRRHDRVAEVVHARDVRVAHSPSPSSLKPLQELEEAARRSASRSPARPRPAAASPAAARPPPGSSWRWSSPARSGTRRRAAGTPRSASRSSPRRPTPRRPRRPP